MVWFLNSMIVVKEVNCIFMSELINNVANYDPDTLAAIKDNPGLAKISVDRI